MCGIVAGVAQRDVVPILIAGLRRLEYRGYDSAGLAVIDDQGKLLRQRAVGKVAMLAESLGEQHRGPIGIAHTRWATHGRPSATNAHPHLSNIRIAVVHNGIIENYEALREELRRDRYAFESETDTEIIGHLIHRECARHATFIEALRAALARLQGSFALAILDAERPDRLWGVRSGSPLVVGVGVGEHFLASDAAALVPLTQQMIYLEEGDLVEISRDSVQVFDAAGQPASRAVRISSIPADSADKGAYRHFMLKEIHEQPGAITATLDGYLEGGQILPALDRDLLRNTRAIHILACGTSYHAGMVARYWIEALAGIPVMVEVASEYRYRTPAVPDGTLMLAISQSGETADTLAALELAKERHYLGRLGICNVPESALTQICDHSLMTRAGLEIGVASTKAFTTQLCALFILALTLAKQRGQLTPEAERRHLESLRQLPGSVQHALNLEPQIMLWADQFADKEHALFLGRGLHYPIALEGALKLKEISYIHAEAYPAGELKHGPLALVDSHMPVVVIAPNDALLEKVKSNMQEVRARGGQLYVFADQDSRFGETEGVHVIRTPRYAGLLSPVVHAIPVQLLAYHTALRKGTDVDKPRNLAKSVTVE